MISSLKHRRACRDFKATSERVMTLGFNVPFTCFSCVGIRASEDRMARLRRNKGTTQLRLKPFSAGLKPSELTMIGSPMESAVLAADACDVTGLCAHNVWCIIN